MKSQTASVHFNETGTPVADAFDDVYYSNDSGIEESRYVFMTANGLPGRWLEHTRREFVIAETGFGTGLNFLVATQAFEQFRKQHPSHPLRQLYFLSTEKFPLPAAAMKKALATFPELSEQASALTEQYPMAMAGCHRRHFAHGAVILDLWIGDIHDSLPQWACPASGLVDAWFLDGFAPSKNPEMWTTPLFEQLQRLSRPQASVATFTSAGVVKRGLQSAGFTVQKIKGFGRKREMLTGVMTSAPDHSAPAGPWARYRTPPVSGEVLIIGAGLAGSACALALCQRGIPVTLCYDDANVASGASGNPQGGFYPQLHAEASLASQIQAHCFLYASEQYRAVTATQPLAHEFCGVLQLGFNPASQTRHNKLATSGLWPEELVHLIEADAASALAGLTLPCPALSIPLGGWLSPPELVKALLALAKDTGLLTLRASTRVCDVEEQPDHVTVRTDKGDTLTASHCIFACGHQSQSSRYFAPLPLRPVRGQVEAVPTTSELKPLRQVLCHKGYLTPQHGGRHALGSTYVKQDTATDIRAAESAMNLATHQQALADCDWIQTLRHDGEARAAVRLGVPDHQPLCGVAGRLSALWQQCARLGDGKPLESLPLPPQSRIVTLTALGSRGLTTAPLLAETLACELLHAPLPLPQTLLNATSPSRFIIRDALRGKLTPLPPAQE
ncbi:bifunctional tRNA (5-methylaminomethyl-2-thiouridine)(34)-methyltransferase MnmD/FAD-dependent 5-carboxymethylaminomethyl-2-thiouridine(34) oxidoreductase MnmC [Alteromonas sp. CYL-A6]|uniref:bifunctional tRNA (5-methylaminomethyl-2-thiouridine)(34)-methyltransferase MnmD/FAD-dependent 5-carboxymethylaminomethyl-2-thiouridine(34) oxidoreductase MnmC n=1 Tax=Alteromonas nitratireducens TaxID=3390813 RepID=UPI0034BC5837